jgi:hypothetical protein
MGFLIRGAEKARTNIAVVVDSCCVTAMMDMISFVVLGASEVDNLPGVQKSRMNSEDLSIN